MAKFGNTSLRRMQGVDSQLIKIAMIVVEHWDCTVPQYGGFRSVGVQRALYEDGKSKKDGITKKSKHQFGRALDLVPYPVDWDDIDRFRAFGGFFLGVAACQGIEVRWGGDWDGDRTFKDQSFIDLPHFELI